MVFLKVDLKKIAGIKNMQNYQVDKELSSALATLLYWWYIARFYS